MSYVKIEEAVGLGASPKVTQLHLDQATGIINAYVKRPEGLLYEVDGSGNPVCMAGLAAQSSFSLAAPVSPGAGVTAMLNGPVSLLQAGDSLVIDRGLTTAEVVAISSISGNTVKLQQVRNAHAAAAPLASGLVVSEQKTMPYDRSVIQLSRSPVVMLTSGAGRYGYIRRGDISRSPDSLFALTANFGGTPVWEPFLPGTAAIDPPTGQVFVPAGFLMNRYTEAKVSYIAGYSVAPDAIKQAACRIANNIAQGGFGVPMQSERLDGISYSRASSGKLSGGGMIDTVTEDLLRPYRLRVFA